MEQKIKELKAQISAHNEQIQRLLDERKGLSRKNIDKPKKASIDAKIASIEENEIKPLAAELAKLRFNNPVFKNFIEFLKSLNGGWSYISIDPYVNEQGEVARHTISVNFNYAEILAKDLKKAAEICTPEFISGLATKHSFLSYQNFETALFKILNPSQSHSDAQRDTYTYLGKGVKFHNLTGELYMTGLFDKKLVMVEGDYSKTENSTPRPETIAKRIILKALKLKSNDFKIYKFEFINSFNYDGETLHVEPLYI